MRLLESILKITRAARWIALATMGLMMLFITYAVINREFFTPVIGDVEIIQLGMVILIMFGLAYSQFNNAHISVGLFVDRLPRRTQSYINLLGYLLTLAVCLIICWVFIQDAIKNMAETRLTTDLLEVPHYPFKFIIAIGFTMWGMEAVVKTINAILELIGKKF